MKFIKIAFLIIILINFLIFTAKSQKSFGFQYNCNGKDSVLVLRVMEKGPAEKAGLQPNDLITRINKFLLHSKTVDEVSNLFKQQPHTNNEIIITRGGVIKTLMINKAELSSFTNMCVSGNCKTGKGKFADSDGGFYEGDFVDGKKEGMGKIEYTDAVNYRYAGEFKNDKRHGNGKMLYKNGALYSGPYINDLRNGSGITTWPNGDKYVGEFKNDKRNGFGKLYNKNENFFEEGLWTDGECKECILDITYSSPLFIVMKNNKSGYINSKGEIIVPFQYDNINTEELPVFNHGRISFKNAGKWGLLDDKGQAIAAPKYNKISKFENGYSRVEIAEQGSFSALTNKTGFINIFGKEVIAVKYEKVLFGSQTINEGRTLVTVYTRENKPLIAYVGINGTEYFNNAMTSADKFTLGLAPVKVENNGMFGYVNKNFDWAINPQFTAAYPFAKEGVAEVHFANASWGLINTKGAIVAKGFNFKPSAFLNGGFFSEGLMLVKNISDQSDKYGFMDAKGELVIPIKYDYAYAYKDGLAVVNEGGTYSKYKVSGGNWLLIDKNGNVKKIFGSTYDVVYSFWEGIAIVEKNNKYGYINVEGKEILPPMYEEKPETFNNGLGRFYLPGKEKYANTKPFGYVNKEGRIIWEAGL